MVDIHDVPLVLWVVVFFGVCGVGVCGVGNVVVFVFFGLFGFGLGVRAVGFVVCASTAFSAQSCTCQGAIAIGQIGP